MTAGRKLGSGSGGCGSSRRAERAAASMEGKGEKAAAAVEEDEAATSEEERRGWGSGGKRSPPPSSHSSRIRSAMGLEMPSCTRSQYFKPKCTQLHKTCNYEVRAGNFSFLFIAVNATGSPGLARGVECRLDKDDGWTEGGDGDAAAFS